MAAASGAQRMVGSDPSPLRVLALVDDDPDIRAVVRLMLREIGAVVELETDCAEEAIARIDPKGVGVVILDDQLKGLLNGLEAAPLLRRRAPGARIVLFSTLPIDER